MITERSPVLPEEASELEGHGESDVVGFEPVVSAEVVHPFGEHSEAAAAELGMCMTGG